MRKHFAIASLLIAWFCANGAVWDVVQVIAWTRMFAGYAEQMPVAEALQQTLDPSKPCPMCKMVQHARGTGQSEQPANPPARETEKLVLMAEISPAPIFSPVAVDWPVVRGSHGETRVDPVIVPPPRA